MYYIFIFVIKEIYTNYVIWYVWLSQNDTQYLFHQ